MSDVETTTSTESTTTAAPASLTADDLAHIAAATESEGQTETTSETGKSTPAKGEPKAAPTDKDATEKSPPATTAKAPAKTLAVGADEEEEEEDETEPAVKAADKANGKAKDGGYWPENWREKMAEYIAAGDKKVYEKELRRLQRVSDPTGVYGNWRELDAKLNGGGLIKVPGKDAKPEEIAAYHKALGVPEKAEDYFKDIQLPNGAVIGEADKPVVDAFVKAVHPAGATPAVVAAGLAAYYKLEEEKAAAQVEADDDFWRQAERTLKDEWGPSYNRRVGAIRTLFKNAPGGPDAKNPNSTFARLMGGRTMDGAIIGNDPEVARFLSSLSYEINPGETVVEDGDPSGMGVERELAEIKALRTSNPSRYWSDTIQTRELELLGAQQKIQARKRG